VSLSPPSRELFVIPGVTNISTAKVPACDVKVRFQQQHGLGGGDAWRSRAGRLVEALRGSHAAGQPHGIGVPSVKAQFMRRENAIPRLGAMLGGGVTHRSARTQAMMRAA